ncbi:Signal transduction histidine-protein kinase BaeS [Corynebacterium faecale]|uniref:sensor histidine kinase n=1 Tax=Corynebacterium faecale TaxID=1758466 RepID=UPI0025B4E4AA|nr:HAMP domain-containing sensor histidine kinase [Corynebacterium faecale]WJY92484.1 Signal transduction histidine-protein kinase BaeS [Corynebacterium faecale]
MTQGANLTLRFLVAQAVVVVISLLSAVAVASLVGPPLFHDHLLMADRADELRHVEQAYQDAGLITLAVAVPIAFGSALLASFWLARKIQTPLRGLTRAATAVAGGNYDVKVPTGDAGPEVTTLAVAFNTMADRLAHTEEVRRQLLSDLAHEMGTPVSVLTVYLDGLQDEIVEWSPETQTVMSEQLQRLTRLIEDLDDVSRAQEDRIELDSTELPLGELIHSSATAAQEAYATKGVSLQAVPVTTPVSIFVDRQRFGQVMGNLLSNALRHTPAGGQVTISARRQGAGTVLIDVADNGEGLTSDQLGHIFERFYRGDAARNRDHGGSGIGLTISKALVEAHGGTLTASSAGSGFGTTLTIRLPLSTPSTSIPAVGGHPQGTSRPNP